MSGKTNDKWILEKSKGVLNKNRLPNYELLEEYNNKINDILIGGVFNFDNKEHVNILIKTLNIIRVSIRAQTIYLSCFDLTFNIIQTLKKANNNKNQLLSQLLGEANAALMSFDERKMRSFDSICDIFLNQLKSKKHYYTHSFVNDYNRIVYCSAFRRLQDKAQVFSLEKYDYVRNRLTHSIEVSSIASQLANLCALNIFDDNESMKKNISFQMEKVLSCAALLHDIGNPPFGHFGEDVIRNYFRKNWNNLKYMQYRGNCSVNLKKITEAPCENGELQEWFKKDFEYFDGNAQSLRIALKLQLYKPNHSLELTAAVLGSIIKYPINAYEMDKDKSKFGYFYSERDNIKQLKMENVYKDNIRNPLVLLLEAADDISYVTSDFEDVIKKGIITYEDFVLILDGVAKDNRVVCEFKDNFYKYYKENQDIAVNSPFELTIKRMINDLRNELIDEVVHTFCEHYEQIIKGISINTQDDKNKIQINNNSSYELLDLVTSAPLIKWIKKDIFKNKVFVNKEIVEIELEGYEIITFLLQTFINSVLLLNFNKNNDEFILIDENNRSETIKEKKIFSLISNNFVEQFKKETANLDVNGLEHIYYRFRLVIDYISGMTDNYAKEVYQILRGIK